MANRPLEKQNWQRRKHHTFSPNFRIDTGNPQMGLSGTSFYDLYAVTDNRDISLVGMTNSGMFHIYNDQSIEIIGGQKSKSTGVDIIITGKNGDVWITAEKNGQVRIRGANIVVDADQNLTLRAGNNIKIQAGNKIDLKANIANVDALMGNLTPFDVMFGGIVFKDTYVWPQEYFEEPRIPDGAPTPDKAGVAEGDSSLGKSYDRITGTYTSSTSDLERSAAADAQYFESVQPFTEEKPTNQLQVGESNSETRSLAAQERAIGQGKFVEE